MKMRHLNNYFIISSSKYLLLVSLVIISLITTASTQCTQSSYQVSPIDPCLPCHFTCLQCIDYNTCVICVQEYYLSNLQSCEPCPYGCKTCYNSTYCVDCLTGLYLKGDGSCVSCDIGVSSCSIAIVQKCSSGYFRLSGMCVGCLTNCAKCYDFVTCAQCSQGYYLTNNSANICSSCSSNCQACISATACQSCARGYTISGGYCSLINCTNISSFCTRCSGSNCLQCQQGFYLSNNTCLQGASLLCQQSVGSTFISCETSNYDCPQYATVQYDYYNPASRLDICLPKFATVSKEYAYQNNYENQPNCTTLTTTVCSTANSFNISVTPRKAFYSLKYYFNIKFYSAPLHNLTVKYGNLTFTHSIDVSKQKTQLPIANKQVCTGCSFGQTIINHQFVQGGYGTINFELSNVGGYFSLSERIIQFRICNVQYCKKCTTAIDCVQCISPYLLQLIQCVTQCDAGFYKNIQNATDTTQEIRQCVLICPSGTYPVQSSYLCNKCVSPCKTCNDSSICLTCQNGFFLQGSTCLTNCSTTEMYTDMTTNKCEDCPNPCTTCQLSPSNSSIVICLSCSVGYLNPTYDTSNILINSSCTYICPIGTYENYANSITICSKCSENCTQCYISQNICMGCIDGYKLVGTTCQQINSCPSGLFWINQTAIIPMSNLTNVCLDCHFPCNDCTSIDKNCTSCSKGSLFLNITNTCPLICPSGYYSSTNSLTQMLQCTVCKSPCLSCSSQTFCSSCIAGKYLYNSQCVDSCPNNLYYQNATTLKCQKCEPPCLQCTQRTSCLSCTTGYYDSVNLACVLKCNATSYISSAFICTSCQSPCEQCFSQTNCTKCILPLAFLADTNSCVDNATCMNLTTSGVGRYMQAHKDISTGLVSYYTCQSCTSPCLVCQISSIYCLSCVVNFSLVSQLHTCVQVCPTSYFSTMNNSVKICSKCDANCLECSTINLNCTKCSSGMYLHPQAIDNTQNNCLQSCPDRYYGSSQDGSGGKCFSCISPCVNCYNSYLCKTCQTGLLLYNKNCVSSCPQGTAINLVSSASQCIACETGCSSCSQVYTNCTACYSGYFHDSVAMTCNSSCPQYYYPNYVTGKCQNCVQPCKQCSSLTICLNCATDYYFEQNTNQCLSACPSGYFAVNSSGLGICQPCNSSVCATCLNSSNTCLSCIVGLYLDGTVCSSNCPTGKYPDPYTGTCKSCIYPCTNCSAVNNCSSCDNNYKLFNNQCFSQCPSGYFSNSESICQKCSNLCLLCLNSTYCNHCVENYYAKYDTGQCVQNCPIGTYQGLQALTYYRKCLACSTQCLRCASSSICQLCASSYSLFNGLCLITCPALHYSQNYIDTYNNVNTSAKKCSICSPFCQVCNNYTYCTQCYNAYIYNYQCFQNCPSQTFSFSDTCQPCQSPCKECISTHNCISCIEGKVLFHQYCLDKCPLDVYLYIEKSQCSETCTGNQLINTYTRTKSDGSIVYTYNQNSLLQYPHPKICYEDKCGKDKMLVVQNKYCIQSCPTNSYVNSDYSCSSCQSNPSQCSDIFDAYIEYLRSNAFTIVIYFSQKAEIASIDNIQIQFQDVEGNVFLYQFTDYLIDQYQIRFTYAFQSLPLVTVTVLIPYICSLQTNQCIQSNVFSIETGIFQNYGSQIGQETASRRLTEITPKPLPNSTLNYISTEKAPKLKGHSYSGFGFFDYLVLSVLILFFVLIIFNIIFRQSHFLQLLDYSQLIALTLYLQLQYPPILQQMLYHFGVSLLNFLPEIVIVPYKFSQSKFIVYHDDSSIFRHVVLILLFFAILIFFCIVLIWDCIKNWKSKNKDDPDKKSTKDKSKHSKIQQQIEQQAQEQGTPLSKRQQDHRDNPSEEPQIHFYEQQDSDQPSQKKSNIFQVKDIQNQSKAYELQTPTKQRQFKVSRVATPKKLDASPKPQAVNHQQSAQGLIIQNLDQELNIVEGNNAQQQNLQENKQSTCEKIRKRLIQRVRYRHINDTFSLFLAPTLLFACAFPNSSSGQIVFSVFILLINLSFIGFICYKIMNIKKMSQLSGLMSEFQPTKHVVGLMYTPFSHIRRAILCMVIGLQPQKPLSALSLMLIFTILILVCLWFYQPFLNIVTDYISMVMEVILVIYIVFLIAIGLNVLSNEVNWGLGITACVFAIFGLIIGFVWLIRLTIHAFKQAYNYYVHGINPYEVGDQSAVQSGKDLNPFVRKIEVSPHPQAQQLSDLQLIKQKKMLNDRNSDIFSQNSSSNKEQFKHWKNSEQSQSSHEEKRKGAPQLLIKMQRQI